MMFFSISSAVRSLSIRHLPSCFPCVYNTAWYDVLLYKFRCRGSLLQEYFQLLRLSYQLARCFSSLFFFYSFYFYLLLLPFFFSSHGLCRARRVKYVFSLSLF